jgi:hypothetical protein
MDEGTRRSPKLKDPGAPGGAKCRGACGVDCPPTCKVVGTYREKYVVAGTGYLIEFPNAILCGTHEGCQWHDACFDVAVGQGENPLSAPVHRYCNVGVDARPRALPGLWYFVDTSSRAGASGAERAHKRLARRSLPLFARVSAFSEICRWRARPPDADWGSHRRGMLER